MPLPLVLVVSDDPSLREEAVYAFPSEVETVTVSNALDAMKEMDERIPSVVISQIRTGHEGGFSLARHMSQHASLRAVPIFMLLERPQDEWLAGQAGATVWRTRPVDTSELVHITMDLLNERNPVSSSSS